MTLKSSNFFIHNIWYYFSFQFHFLILNDVNICPNSILMFRLLLVYFIFVTDRNEVVAKVIFLHLSVILFTGGVSASVHAGIPHLPPRADTPLGADTPWSRHPPRSRHPLEQTPPPRRDPPRADTPWEQTPPRADTPQEQTPPWSRQNPQSRHPPRSRHPPGANTPPPRSRFWHTVNERPVRILLECILVSDFMFYQIHFFHKYLVGIHMNEYKEKENKSTTGVHT